MLRVEIISRSGWVDHFGAPIDRLVFSKKYYDQYAAGCYPLESFGGLYRNVDDFRQSPLQSLSDWEIRIPSVYSSKDGTFQTVDLLYHLEAVNEDFDLIGCRAVLFDDSWILFDGVVNSISSGTGGASISIGESIGSPEIKKRDFPVVFGNADLSRWPVKISKNEMNRTVIEISDRMLESFGGFFAYLEKRKQFVLASFQSGKFSFATGWQSAVLGGAGASKGIIRSPIGEGEPFAIDYHNFDPDHIRPDPEKETPDNYIASDDNSDYTECVQAWSSRLSDNGNTYVLGRDIPERQHSFSDRGELKELDADDDILIEMRNDPESLTLVSPISNPSSSPYTRGNPSAFLELSGKYVSDWGSSRYDKPAQGLYPEVFYAGLSNSTQVVFVLNFPETELPADGFVFYLRFALRLFWSISYSPSFNISNVESLGVLKCSVQIGDFISPLLNLPSQAGDVFTHSFEFDFYSGARPKVSDLRSIKLVFNIDIPSLNFIREGSITLLAGTTFFKARVPLSGVKLYASGTFPGSSNSTGSTGESIISSVKGLLNAAGVPVADEFEHGYDVVEIGALSDAQYGLIAGGESVSLRDKMRSLAAESATLIRFAPNAKEILVKSVSRQIEHIPALIPLSAIVLENNIYDFKMESSHRDDIASGLLIYWGKNAETGKYEHSLLFDSAGLSRDDEYARTAGMIDHDKLESILNQLAKNSNANVGNIKSIESEWIVDWEGAELMAYNYLCWNCAPLRKAQVNCILSALEDADGSFDIGDFIYLVLPGYPDKLAQTAWVITGRHDDLDKMVTALELLEVWDMPVISPERFLLLESGEYILTEAEEKIKLESSYA